MSGKQHVHENQSNKGAVAKPEKVTSSDWSDEQVNTQNVSGSSETLPHHSTNLAQRRQAILQLQRSRGNNFVMRQALPSVMRQEHGEAAEAAVPTEIASDGNRVSTSGAVTVDSAGIVTINAPIIQANGLLQASTIMADSVIASSYSPGAGNVM